MSLYSLQEKMKTNLQVKMVTLLLSVVLVLIISIVLVSIFSMKNNIEREAYDKQRLLTESFHLQIKEFIIQNKNVITLTSQLPVVKDMSAVANLDVNYRGVAESQDVEKRALSKQLLKTYPSFAYFETFTPDKGISIMLEPYDVQLKISPQAFTNGFSGRDWFKGAMSTRATYLSEAYISASVGKQVVAISTPITDNDGKITGVWIGALSLDALSDIARKLTFGKTGYAYLVDKNGVLIAHPDEQIFGEKKELVKVSDCPVVERVLKGEKGNGVFYNPLTKQEVLATYSPIEGTSWYIIVEQDVNEAFNAVKQIQMIMVGLGLALVCLFSVIVFFITRKITKPILSVTEAVKKAADGDLTAQCPVLTQDEIGQLAQAANVMTNNLRNLVKDVQLNVQQVAVSSEQLTASASQAAQASNQVAGSVTEVASGAEKLLQIVEDVSQTVEQMSDNLRKVAEEVNEVACGTAKSAESAQLGVKSAQIAISQMKQLEDTVSASSQVVGKLGNRSIEIGQIVDTISGIAGQTNLLALNAAIEAARAGEQGRGFAVVAEEVRKLAEQSQEAAKQIAHLIGEIQSETALAVAAMDEGTNQVKQGTSAVSTTGAAFEEIAGIDEKTAEMVSDILGEIQNLANGSQQIVAAIKKVEELNKVTAGETQTVSAATEEQSASMEEIASSSQSLAQMAGKLQDHVNKFKI